MMNNGRQLPVANYMGASSFGSFAPVGDRLVDSCAAESGRRYLAVEIGEVCQLACRHCIYGRPKSKTPRPNAAVLDEVAAAVHGEYRPIWITFAGKEATIFPRQLVDTARRVRSPGTTNILMTNGLRLKDKLIDELSDLIDLFDISVDGTKEAHDWMRGVGTYDQTWDRIQAILSRTSSRVGLIATAVAGSTSDGERQVDSVIALANEIVARCGPGGRVVLATSLYFGAPEDPMLLRPGDISDLIKGLAASGCPSRVLLTANYAHQWGEIARTLGLDGKAVHYDVATALPVVAIGCTTIIPFNLSQVPQISARISNDGLVFLGCNHLTLGDEAANHAIADLSHEGLGAVLKQLADGSRPIFDALSAVPVTCSVCPDFEVCRGGDRLSGSYFRSASADPFCSLVRSDVQRSNQFI